jgi:hypothetical protein
MKRYSREMIVVAAVFENLMHRRHAIDTLEEQLVVDALRRSTNALQDANLSDLGDYISGLDEAQLRGVANNVKGIYHELHFVHDYNETHTDSRAEAFSETNHPDADVLIRDTRTGEVIQELQLKASDSPDYALSDFDPSSTIQRLATHEAASGSAQLGDSGYFDNVLESDVSEQLSQVAGLSLAAQAIHGAETSSLISAALHGYEILQGTATPAEATKRMGVDVAIATGTTALVALLFS